MATITGYKLKTFVESLQEALLKDSCSEYTLIGHLPMKMGYYRNIYQREDGLVKSVQIKRGWSYKDELKNGDDWVSKDQIVWVKM